jgi:ParB-like chromosome segregation protein Spo0J
MGTAVEEKAIYQTINEKMGETVSLSPEKLHLSEYNTRSTCVDRQHVENLAARITEQGFHPKRAISVNVIRGAGGAETAYRVAAGVHRFEAAKKAGLKEIPCLIYYDLTEDEECFLDKWDNEMDESHKQIHFLDEAEHYKYLQEIKGWSQRQIARNKNISKTEVVFRLQIAKMPKEAKQIIRGGGHHGDHFSERHFRDICKLSEPHIIAICEEIASKGSQAEKGEKDTWGKSVTPMKQAEIKKRVGELLKLEQEGNELTRVKEALSTQLSLFVDEDREKEAPDAQEHFVKKIVVAEKEEIPEEPPTPVHEIAKEKKDIRELVYRSREKNSRGLNLDRCVRWLKNSGLVRELGQTAYIVLRKMEEYDLWYRANQDEPFFFGPDKDPFALIAEQAGVEKEHLQKRSLPFLKKEGFIDYWMDKGLYWFKLNWDRLFDVYLEKAHTIPFDEDGLENIPPDFTGIIRPTPFHFIRIEKGQVTAWNGTAPKAKENERDHLAQALLCLKPPMGDREILFCVERRPETETALKLMGQMDPLKRKEIKNEAAYVLELVRRRPNAPQGFVTPQEAREKEEGTLALKAFLKSFREKRYTRFCPKENRAYVIMTTDDHGFEIEKEDGLSSYCHFKDWMDHRFFR